MYHDSRESLNHRDPPGFLSLDTSLDIKSLDIKTQDLKVSIPLSISRLKLQKSWFQSQYQDSTFNSLNSSLVIKNQVPKFKKHSLVVLEAITNKVLEEDSDADSESNYKEEIWSNSDKELDNDHWWWVKKHFITLWILLLSFLILVMSKYKV